MQVYYMHEEERNLGLTFLTRGVLMQPTWISLVTGKLFPSPEWHTSIRRRGFGGGGCPSGGGILAPIDSSLGPMASPPRTYILLEHPWPFRWTVYDGWTE